MGNIPIWYFVIVPAFGVVYMISMLMVSKSRKASVKKWLEENRDAAKVYVNKKNHAVTALLGQLNVHSVDGESPKFFYDKLSQGFYVTPGTHTVESSFVTSRPGILYRRVTTTFGPSKQEICAEANKTYNYIFDTKEKAYRFELMD